MKNSFWHCALLIILGGTQVWASAEKVVLLPEDSKIPVILTQSISSGSSAVAGQPIEAEVKEDVVIDERVVIKKGAAVKGSISNIQRAQRLGKGGNISIQIHSVKAVDGQKISLRSATGGSGKDKTGSTIALTVLVSPLFLLKKGHEAGIRKGTEFPAYVDEDVTIKSSLEPNTAEVVAMPTK